MPMFGHILCAYFNVFVVDETYFDFMPLSPCRCWKRNNFSCPCSVSLLRFKSYNIKQPFKILREIVNGSGVDY